MSKKKRKIPVSTDEQADNYPHIADGDSVDVAEPQATADEKKVSDAPPSTEAPEPSLEEQVDQWKDKFLRSKADFQNLQRRSENERREAVRFGNADLLRSLLELVDDFERTLQQPAESEEARAILDGVKLMHENLQKILQTHRVRAIEAQGEPFDPNLHEALMYQVSDEVPVGHVLQVVRSGYKMEERLLRPARVIIAKESDQAGGENADKDTEQTGS